MDVFGIIRSLNSIVKSSLNDSIEIKTFLISLQSQIDTLIKNSTDENMINELKTIEQYITKHIRTIDEETKILVQKYKTISVAA